MKISNAGYIAKAVALIATGLILGFFPKVLSGIFFVLGVIIIGSCVLVIIPGMFSGDGGGLISSGVTGVIIGAIVIFLPKILELGISIFGGIAFIIWGIVKLGRSAKEEKGSDKRLFSIITGCALVVLGVLLFFNPFGLARKLIGVVLILIGVYNIYIAYAINEHNKGASGGVIDIDSFTVSDDDDKKYLN